jgi:hypothetical protein
MALASAFVRTWGRDFKNKAIFVAGDFNETSVPDVLVRSLLINGIKHTDPQRISYNVLPQPPFQNKPPVWKAGQHLFLEAASQIGIKFPDAYWYLLIDQDSMLHITCFLRSVSSIDAKRAAVAMGDFQMGGLKDHNGQPLLSYNPGGILMGGAGTVWSMAAQKRVDFSHCLNETMAGGNWDYLNSDWRVTKCFDHFRIPILPILGMYQLASDDMAKGNGKSWYANWEDAPCNITQHRVSPSDMQHQYQADIESGLD